LGSGLRRASSAGQSAADEASEAARQEVGFMHLASLRTVGGSVMLAIPKTLLEMLGLRPDTKVGLSVDNGKLVIEPRPRPRYTLAELVGQCDPHVPTSPDDQAWMDAPAAGREAL
jgi:antitoxin ChpS